MSLKVIIFTIKLDNVPIPGEAVRQWDMLFSQQKIFDSTFRYNDHYYQ